MKWEDGEGRMRAGGEVGGWGGYVEGGMSGAVVQSACTQGTLYRSTCTYQNMNTYVPCTLSLSFIFGSLVCVCLTSLKEKMLKRQ